MVDDVDVVIAGQQLQSLLPGAVQDHGLDLRHGDAKISRSQTNFMVDSGQPPVTSWRSRLIQIPPRPQRGPGFAGTHVVEDVSPLVAGRQRRRVLLDLERRCRLYAQS